MHRNRSRRRRKTHSSNQWTEAFRPAHVFRRVTFVQRHFHARGPVAHVNSVKGQRHQSPDLIEPCEELLRMKAYAFDDSLAAVFQHPPEHISSDSQ